MCDMQLDSKPTVSVIVPVHNASEFLAETFHSILMQKCSAFLEVSVYDDASTDCSADVISMWKSVFEKEEKLFVAGLNTTGHPGGVGFAKNRAIQQSHGRFLCFQDADDVMLPSRIESQLSVALKDDGVIVGSMYDRIPEGSTQRYTEWSNSLSKEQLYLQIYTAFGPTLINPTWFCSRKVYERAGPFVEHRTGFPEDLIFFYRHLNQGGRLHRVDRPLLLYRYHPSSASFGVHEDTIWSIRLARLEEFVLKSWSSFTIWNAGKQGRKLYRSLSAENRAKVVAMCDVDAKKIEKSWYTCELIKGADKRPVRIPIVHFSASSPPYVICVKLNLTGGGFEQNLASLSLKEGVDYVHFG